MTHAMTSTDRPKLGSGNSLPKRRIGRTALAVTELGLGAAPLGNLYVPVSDAAARATLHAALAAGFCYIDTAPYYGFGLSEQRVGEALFGREEVVVSTKVGRLLQPDPDVRDDTLRCGFRSSLPFRACFDYSYDGVMRSWKASLERLGLQRVHVLYVHDIGRATHSRAHAQTFHQLTVGGGLRALAELRAAREIMAVGIGVNEIEVCLEVLEHTDLDVILLAGRYTLLEQEALDALFPECARRGTSIIVGGPYNSGVLATGTCGNNRARYNYELAPPSVIARVRRIEAICQRYGVTLPAAALQFPLAHPQVAAVIPGLGSPARIAETTGLYRQNIPEDFWRDLKAQELVRRDAPIPVRTPKPNPIKVNT
jgi:D-threo-aldose 1-dehydrogenase